MTTHLQKVCLLKQLSLPNDIIQTITIMYKYDNLQKTYKFKFNELNKHFLYYCWLNKKLNKKGDQQTILQTIREFDYYKPKHYFKLKKPSAS